MFTNLKERISYSNNSKYVLMSYPYKNINNPRDLDLSSRCILRFINQAAVFNK